LGGGRECGKGWLGVWARDGTDGGGIRMHWARRGVRGWEGMGVFDRERQGEAGRGRVRHRERDRSVREMTGGKTLVRDTTRGTYDG
jgi:hypothetical protein